jgi:intein/homing endonuclease
MIISDKVLTHLLPFSQPDVFELEVSKNIVRWITDYYERYKVAPKKHIKDLYEAEKGKLKQGLDEEVGLFLTKLSEEYLSEGGPDGVNEDFLIDKGREYLKIRHLRRVAEGINSLLDIGRNEEAEKFYETNKKIVDEVTYNWAKPLDDPNFLNMVFEEKDVPLFRMKGKLGDLLGDLYRGWLVTIMGPMKRGKCIAKGSLIPLANGSLIPIEEVKKGDLIITLNDELKLEHKKVDEFYDNGVKPIFSVTTRSGREVKVTNNHPFLTINGWKDITEIGEGDFIAVPRCYSNFGKKLMVGYELRLLAYLLAEGCIGSGGSGSTPTFTNKDIEIQEDFVKIIEKMGDLAIRSNQDPITFSIVGKAHSVKTERRYGPKTYTKIWYRNLGLKESKSKFKEIPNAVFQLRKSCLATFLSILFCCDGSIWKDRNQIIINYSSASKIFIKQIHHLLLRFGIIGRVTRRKVKGGNDHTYWEFTIKDKENSLKFLKEIGFIIGYKKEYVKKFLNEIEIKKEGRGFLDNFPKPFTESVITPEIKKFITNNGKQTRSWWKTRPVGNVEQSHRLGTALTRPIITELAKVLKSDLLSKYAESQIIWDKITKIVPIAPTNTYDLTIEGNHNFIANDIIVHNTWILQDFAFDALLSRKRVVYMSFEMKDKHQAVRIYKQLGVMGEKEDDQEYIFPCFDCMNNQDNSCNNATRMNNEAAPSKFDPKAPGTYRPCTACRKIPGGGNFLATTWFFVAERPKLTLPNTRKEIKKFQRVFGKDLLRIISFPAYSATMADVEDQLDELERVEGFIPDVIITDYASIIRPEQKYGDPRHEVDDVFKAHKRLAQTRSALVVTGAQSLGVGRSALKKDMQDEGDIGVNAYILAHVDIMMTLDQTPEEKEKGIWRMGVIEHRWKQFNKRRQVMALQQLELGMPVLDTEIIFYNSQNKKED